MLLTQKRLWGVILGIISLSFSIWLELFIQRQQHVIGGGLNRSFLFLLINAHILVIIALLYLIIRHSVKLFLERKKGTPGSIFKRNLLFAFTLFSVIPSFFVFFTAGKFITRSIDKWFAHCLGNGFVSAFKLHNHYSQNIRNNLMIYGNDCVLCIENILEQKNLDKEALAKAIRQDIAKVKLPSPILSPSIYVWDVTGRAIVGSLHEEALVWRKFRIFNDRTIASLKHRFLNTIKGITDKQSFDFYGSLYFVKKIDTYFLILAHRYPTLLRQALIELENAMVDYEQLYLMRNSIYVSYFFTFVLLTLLILFLSLWCAFYLAKGISKPINELIDATEKIRQGRWDTHVVVHPSSDVQSLAHGFNEMTAAVRQAQATLELKNKEIRAILEHISLAVFFINKFGRVIFCNAAAYKLAEHYMEITSFKDKKINSFGSAIQRTCLDLMRDFYAAGKEEFSKEITLACKAELRTFVICIRKISILGSSTTEKNGFLFVVDDVTDIMKINKIKVWQHAAKQMAHEIKNPLTPIQLATQRLQRNFKNQLSDNHIFFDCTNTILDQVKIIKDLVTHFFEFSSMPLVSLEVVNINQLINEVLCLYHISYPDIVFTYDPLPHINFIQTDKTRIKRVLINLLDNSVRALQQSSERKDDSPLRAKVITIKLFIDHNDRQQIHIIFSDSGPGISADVKESLFLPYVSTEKKNMGLGLAIVHDSITQLGGTIALVPTSVGATFHIVLPQ